MPLSVLTKNDFSPKRFDEVAKKFADRAPLTSEQFDQLSVAQRAQAFRVLGVHKAQLVQQIRRRLAAAIRDGTSYVDFRRSVAKLFATAKIPSPSLGTLKLAFRQNVMTAHNDARRAVLDRSDIRTTFPFRQYITVGDGTPGVRNVREAHARLHNKVFRSNDRFWDRFTPPWEFNCRCTFIALTEKQFRRSGKTLWTWRGGSITPVGDARAKPFRLKPNPDILRRKQGKLDLSALDADLRKAVEEILK